MKKQRKHYRPKEKVAILSRHLVEGVPISDPPAGRAMDETGHFRFADNPSTIRVRHFNE